MGAGIRDGIVWDVLRQVGIVPIAVEGKLQNLGTRHLELVTECLHIWSDNAQIFDDERKAQLLIVLLRKRARPGPAPIVRTAPLAHFVERARPLRIRGNDLDE